MQKRGALQQSVRDPAGLAPRVRRGGDADADTGAGPWLSVDVVVNFVPVVPSFSVDAARATGADGGRCRWPGPRHSAPAASPLVQPLPST